MNHSTMVLTKEKRDLSMANATWDQPETLKGTSTRTRVDKLEHCLSPLLRIPSPKHKRRSSKHQRELSHSRRVNIFITDKDIEQLLSLLRDPSFCRSSVSHDANPIPQTIMCDSDSSPELQQPTTDKQAPGQEIIKSPSSECSLDSSLSDDSTRPLDCEFVGKRSENLEADRGHFFLRAESSSV
jgi:hypothetical protein